ncbi:extracellular solute-binding protein [Endozoicomonas montiporae]|nr:extracellular solute-binding protein [Endozoicomonas montiporae]
MMTPFAWAKERIEFMVPPGDYMNFVSDVIKPEYERRYPGVELVVTSDGNLETRMAAGDYPNVYAGIFGYQVARYARLGRLAYLNQFDGFDGVSERVDQDFMAENFGRNYFIPWHATTQMMIYNKELFAEAGLDPEKPPVTWDEYVYAAKKISQLPRRRNGSRVYGSVFWNEEISSGSWYWSMLSQMYYNFNNGEYQLLNRYGTHPVFDRKEAGMAEFMGIMREIQKYSPLTMEQDFFSRTIGMWPQYGFGWRLNLQDALGGPMEIGKDVGIAPLPVRNEGDPHFSNLDGRALMMFKNTHEIEDLSWNLIELLMEDRFNLKAAQALQQLPTLRSLKEHPHFQTEEAIPFVNQLENTVMNESFASVADVSNIVLRYYSRVVLRGELEPEEAVRRAGQKARKVLRN